MQYNNFKNYTTKIKQCIDTVHKIQYNICTELRKEIGIMAQTTINVRMDEDLKKQFEIFCNETGLNMSTAINMFIKTVVREHQIPFKITADPFYSEENMAHLKKAIKDLEEGKGVEHDLIEVED